MELLFRQDAYLRGCDATVTGIDAAGIRLDRTVFYPMGGGQPGDVGFLRLANGDTIEIADTVKGANHEDVVHVPKAGSALPQVGDKVHAGIDWERRYRLLRMHTCLHLLSAVIKGGRFSN